MTVVTFLACGGVSKFRFSGLRNSIFLYCKAFRFCVSDLSKVIRLSTVDGYSWDDTPFNLFIQNQASDCVRSLKSISQICLKDSQIDNKPFLKTLGSFGGLIIWYKQQRSRIPSESKWYHQVPRHETWFLIDYSRLSIALQTNTSIQPKIGCQSRNWMEARIY